MINSYYQLVKPRMVMMNVLVAAAVFVFASPTLIEWDVFVFTMSGLAFVVAGACALNNVADRKLDAKMDRTKGRAVATGQIAPMYAVVFGLVLFAVGVRLLVEVHILALLSALVGFGVYVFLYTPLKPKTGYALYMGAVAGATPPLVGYAAAAHQLDWVAWGLFAILFLWQIPHFLAIARYRFGEYSAAGVPLLVTAPTTEEARHHARKIFYLSLVALVLLCLGLILHRWIR